ncbi:MAG: HAD-IIIA family hydrolase [Gemmatimonadaceae bacterium]|nr:HAD-IIIA family hydrolase [Gemmatimonadaceae bacterium]
MNRPSVVFMDRDGTLINDAHYISDPALVRLLPGAAAAVARLNVEKIPVIVVTNQSGIGRGYFTALDYEKVRARFEELLSAQGARIDGSYLCPHSSDDHCICRKPRRELFERAIRDHAFDKSRLIFIGDRWRDVEAFLFYEGARGAMVPSEMTPSEERERAERLRITYPDLSTALDALLS